MRTNNEAFSVSNANTKKDPTNFSLDLNFIF